ncbi:hypothetical protein CTI12_AA273660 [Artemisia annua]|uniref:Uncharacterized protein n=1 Tax=Artemisia annua TaxID=35608 RepID=A0A2U1NFJ2_ARTAN|nr:hypothetical protein CTI12_AA273660 [Artemisia annua]
MDPNRDYWYYQNWIDNICNFDTVSCLPYGFQICLRDYNRIFEAEINDITDERYRQDRYDKPMLWIGIHIAVASLFCILAMVAGLIHGLKNRKLWFPSTMNGKELLTNVIALDILVITLIVKVCIQIYTSVIRETVDISGLVCKIMALFYVAMLLILLIIHTCSGLTILKSKQIIELKYQAGHETALKGLELQQPGRLTVEKLKQHVKNHWIMAGTGSPQFITACSATTSASGVICVVSTVIHVIISVVVIQDRYLRRYGSDYNWSIPVILIIQCIGSLVGTIAPLCRCYVALSFKLSIKWIWNHIKVFKVESYWTQKLYDWKQRKNLEQQENFNDLKGYVLQLHDDMELSERTLKSISKSVNRLIKKAEKQQPSNLVKLLSESKGLQKTVVVAWKNPEQQENFNDLKGYVLQLHDDMELSERTLKSISKSVNRLIKKAEKQQPSNLVKLLSESKGFEGVGKYDSLHIPPLIAEDYLDCWSLPLVTLTAIAVSLPKIQNDIVDRLLSSVSEGLTYVTLVEESLNATDDYVSIQKAAKALWLEVEVSNKWVGNNLKNHAPEVNTAGLILQWFKNTAKNMVTEVQVIFSRSANDNSIYRSICENSMYRITESILLSYRTNIDELSQEDLFTELSSTIADILAACLTNLP